MRRRALVLVVVALVAALCTPRIVTAAPLRHHGGGQRPALSGDVVLEWNAAAADAALASKITPAFDPLHEARLYAMMHLAVHDALNAIDRRYAPYRLDIGTVVNASPEAAVAVAAHDVLVPLLEQLPADISPDIAAGVKVVEDHYQAALSAVPEGKAKNLGMVVGRAAAATILAARADDGSDGVFLDKSYPEGTEPGQFKFVRDGPFAVAPTWGSVTPFAMTSGSQFRPGPPYDVKSHEYFKDYQEIQWYGSAGWSPRSAEQTEIAWFWWESSPLKWNRIGRTLAAQAGLDGWDAARLFALLGAVQADGYIANWDAKYVYDFWRPETAIHEGAKDGNPETVGDPNWVPLFGSSGATPEWDSGHAIEGAASAAVLQSVFHTDTMTFEACSYSTPLPENLCTGTAATIRTFTSFSQAARENAESRIFVGWHFRHSIEEGLQHGKKIGRYTVRHILQPVA